MKIPRQLAAQTPCLLLDEDKLLNNIKKMIGRYQGKNVNLRPHLKTSKSIQIAQLFTKANINQFTVSTLKEAEYFVTNGIKDLFYAVSMIPGKISRVVDLNKQGANISICVDNIDNVKKIVDCSVDCQIKVYIEIDVDQHRTGVNPRDEEKLVSIAKLINSSKNFIFKGVFAHAGESYSCQSIEEIAVAAQNERKQTSLAAKHITQAGIQCDVISVGSTPTASVEGSFFEINEMRAGVFVFQDVFQSNLNVCRRDEIALSLLTSVISHSKDNNRLVVDAGGLALSKDRSTASQKFDCRYGLVCDVDGNILENIILDNVNQEHGYITSRDSSPVDFEQYPIGSHFRILPNHACMTASAHDGYHLVKNNKITEYWPRISGW